MVEAQPRRALALPPGDRETDVVVGVDQLAGRLVQVEPGDQAAVDPDLCPVARSAAGNAIQAEGLAEPGRRAGQGLARSVVFAQAQEKARLFRIGEQRAEYVAKRKAGGVRATVGARIAGPRRRAQQRGTDERGDPGPSRCAANRGGSGVRVQFFFMN
jgi:hypothetical protein